MVQGNNPPRGGGAGFPIRGEQHVTNFASGTFAWNLNPQGQPAPQPGAAEFRQFMMTVSPYGFIKAALAAGDATLSTRYFNRLDKTMRVVGFTAGKYRVTGEFNNDNLLERVVTWFPNPVMGDMQVEIRYTEYKDVDGGAKFPFHIHAHQGDHPLITGGRNWLDVRVTDAKVNVANAAVAVPDNVRNAPAPQVRVVATKLADGVWLMGGGSHNSLAVEFKDYITVIEGPLDDARSMAVIAEVKKTIPNKPIRYLVNTHHHWDHLGGTRSYVAEGATVIVPDQVKSYFEQVAKAPHTIAPDLLAQQTKAANIVGVSDQMSLKDDTMEINLHNIPNPHVDSMIIGHVVKDNIVWVTDIWSPGRDAARTPGVLAVNDAVKKIGIKDATFAGGHGTSAKQSVLDGIVAQN